MLCVSDGDEIKKAIWRPKGAEDQTGASGCSTHISAAGFHNIYMLLIFRTKYEDKYWGAKKYMTVNKQ
jgi:hypothetical protein